MLDVRAVATTWLAFVLLHNLGPTLLLSVQPSLFTRMFEAGVRYTGMSMAYQVSSNAGGYTLLFSLWLLRQSGAAWPGAAWPVAALVVTVTVVPFLCTWRR